MIIISRCVTVSKTIEEVNEILRGSAYPLIKPSFYQNYFSIRVVRKYPGRGFRIIPIKGSIVASKDYIKVIMEIHVESTVVIGAILVLLGLVGLLWCYVCSSERWLPFVGSAIIGIIIILEFIWDTKDVLDQLENKLQR